MDNITLQDKQSGSSASLSLKYGFNCYEFKAVIAGRTVDVIDSAPDFPETGQRASGNGIPILFPFPNRIREGKFQWNGKAYHIPESAVSYNNGNVIHGFCLDRPWRLIDSGDQYAVGQFQLSLDAPDCQDYWPADFIIEIRYSLNGANLRADIQIKNPDSQPLPWGFGTHPYFKLPFGTDSQAGYCLVTLDAAEQWELDACMPTGQRVPVPADKDLREGVEFSKLSLDDVYTGLSSDSPILDCDLVDEQAGIQLTQRYNSDFREVVMFTPPGREAICLEPYTCVTDAINLQQQDIDAGLQILPPGETKDLFIEIEVGEIVA